MFKIFLGKLIYEIIILFLDMLASIIENEQKIDS